MGEMTEWWSHKDWRSAVYRKTHNNAPGLHKSLLDRFKSSWLDTVFFNLPIYVTLDEIKKVAYRAAELFLHLVDFNFSSLAIVIVASLKLLLG